MHFSFRVEEKNLWIYAETSWHLSAIVIIHRYALGIWSLVEILAFSLVSENSVGRLRFWLPTFVTIFAIEMFRCLALARVNVFPNPWKLVLLTLWSAITGLVLLVSLISMPTLRVDFDIFSHEIPFIGIIILLCGIESLQGVILLYQVLLSDFQ